MWCAASKTTAWCTSRARWTRHGISRPSTRSLPWQTWNRWKRPWTGRPVRPRSEIKRSCSTRPCWNDCATTWMPADPRAPWRRAPTNAGNCTICSCSPPNPSSTSPTWTKAASRTTPCWRRYAGLRGTRTPSWWPCAPPSRPSSWSSRPMNARASSPIWDWKSRA